MKLKKLILLFFSLILIVSMILIPLDAASPYKAANPDIKSKNQESNIDIISEKQIENKSFILTATDDGAIEFYVKSSGKTWSSNPVNRNSRTEVKGIKKMQMNSQLIITYLDKKSNEKQATSYASATAKDGITISACNDGILIEYFFKNEELLIPVLYNLTSEGMKAQILTSKIKENSDNKLIKITLLPYWGAADNQEEGYFLVPDGCGAIINFNNGKTGSNYQQDIYSTDGLMNVKENKTVVDKAYLPVFGIKKKAQSILGVIEEGASSCRLYSNVSNENEPYNLIYPQFTYRTSSVTEMLSKTWYPLNVTFVSKKKADDEDFSVLYIPLDNDNGTYSDMAVKYREYLKQHHDFSNIPNSKDVPLYLDIYGSATVSKNLLGFPVNINKSLTDCNQVVEILSKLRDSGISNLKVRYKGISKDGLDNKKVPMTFKVASSIGGKNKYGELIEFVNKNNIKIYPEVDFIFYNKSKYSLFGTNKVVQDVSHKNGIFYSYDISNGRAITEDTQKYALKPDKVVDFANKYLKSYKKGKYDSLAPTTLGNMLYSDYGEAPCLSSQTMTMFVNVLEKYKSEDISLLLEAPYIYSVPYADAIMGLPVESSKFDIEDYDVPFYQLTLHGLVSYSVPSVNMSTSSKYAVLKAIETGSSIMYSLSSTEYAEIINENYKKLNCIYVNDWLQEISQYGIFVYEALKKVSDKEIKKHSMIAENVFSTEYENGITILVNYNDKDVLIDGNVIGTMNYRILEGD